MLQDRWQDGIEGGTEVHEEDPGVAVSSVQMLQGVVQSHVHGVLRGSICPVCKLQRVHQRIGDALQLGQDQALQHLHDYRGQSNRSVVIKDCDLGFLGNRNNGRSLETCWDVALLQ